MKVLVTGATGFVGTHLTRQLTKRGDEVSVIVRRSSDTHALTKFLKNERIHEHDGTIARMVDIVATAEPNAVIHLVSLFISEHKTSEIEALVSSNLSFGLQLLEGMALSGVRNFVNAGTIWQNFKDEDYNPVNLYAATKEAFEDLARFYVEAHDFTFTTLKLYETYGPEDSRRKLLPLLIEAAKSGEKLSMTPGEQLLDFVHIDDVVSAFIMAADRQVQGEAKKIETFALSSKAQISLLDLVKLLEEVSGSRLRIEFGGRPYRKREVMVPCQARRLLPGWEAKISLRDGLSQFLGNHV